MKPFTVAVEIDLNDLRHGYVTALDKESEAWFIKVGDVVFGYEAEEGIGTMFTVTSVMERYSSARDRNILSLGLEMVS